MDRGLISLKDLLIGDRVFRIPVYQRNYSWEHKQWEDLWDDLLYVDLNKKHYFGTMLMNDTGDVKSSGLRSFEVHEIIDGQQRLITLVILIKELLSRLKEIGNDDILEEISKLEEDYLRYKGIYKLELLADDDPFFREFVVNDVEFPDAALTPSQRRLKEAKFWFRDRLKDLPASQADDLSHLLIQIKQKIDNIELIRHTVETDADAVLVFETVNNRGKALSNLEKTKSFLMHMVYLSVDEEDSPEHHLRDINERFSNTYRYLEEVTSTENGKFLDEDSIQRYHFVMHDSGSNADISYQYLVSIRSKVRKLYETDRRDCLAYILSYVQDLEAAFFALKEIVTYNGEDQVGKILKRIFVLGRIANALPLLIGIWCRFSNDKAKLAEVLSLVEKLVFRVYAIGRRRADAGETRLYGLAHKVHQGKLGPKRIVSELTDVIRYYEDDNSLESDLKSEDFYNRIANRDIKYLLFHYEQYLAQQDKEPLNIVLDNILSPTFEIEHIWAQQPRICLKSKR